MTVFRSSIFLTATLAAFAGGSVACAPPQAAPPERGPAPPAGTDRLKPTYDTTGKLQKLQYDRNSDGRIDTWGYMDGTRVVKVEVDENGDGTVDRWEYHRADGPADSSAATAARPGAAAGPGAVDTTIERIERATRFDGRVSRREFFTDGVLTKTEEDTDGDGQIDKWETYVDGGLSVMALDTQGRGTPDRRLVYRSDGSLDRIEADRDGSGIFVAKRP
jgi:hypothetical protein